MYLNKRCNNYADLIQYMQNDGYAWDYVRRIKTEINWLSKNAEKKKIRTYEDAYRIRCHARTSHMRKWYRIIYGIFKRFDLYNEYPSRRPKDPLIKRSAYHKLNASFKAVIDLFKETGRKNGLKEITIKGYVSSGSCFLLAMQDKGHSTLENITEQDTMAFFTGDDGIAVLNGCYKQKIEAVFKANLGACPETVKRILAYLPTLRRRRKNIQYLTPEEIHRVHEMLGNNESSLTLKSRAMGLLLFFTGIRGCDIAQMRLSDIDWDKDKIRLVQQKTGNELTIQLSATIGNAIYEYITIERPKSEDTHLFLSEVKPYTPLVPKSIGYISQKIYEAAGIRQKPGDRRGTHLFRYNFATSLSEKAIPRVIISDMLGHVHPDSLDSYLSADIKHLRECALSIEDFPVRKGVFQI